MNNWNRLLLIVVAACALLALFLGDLVWVFLHAPKLTLYGFLLVGFVVIMHMADDVRSRYAFGIGEVWRAKVLGYERSDLDRKVDFLRREWIRYQLAARFRAADRTRRLLDAAEVGQRLLREKLRQDKDE